MVELPTLREMLDAGVHFGHKTSRWSPRMAPYIFMAKSGVHVINLEKTQEKLKEALDFLVEEAKSNKAIVFVGTKKQSQDIIKMAAGENSIAYINERWLGGTLTNYDAIKAAIIRYKKQLSVLSDKESNLSKTELSKLRKEVARGEKLFGGLIDLDCKPEILVLFGSHDEKNALKEAKAQGVKIVALVDTNADPTEVDYPVPANDDATKSVKLFVELFAEVIKEARAESPKVAETK